MIEITKSGRALAAAAFTLAVTGVVMSPAPASAGSKVTCYGVNACKSQAACKTSTHSCKGQNACKGQGWITTTAEQCAAWGGKTKEG